MGINMICNRYEIKIVIKLVDSEGLCAHNSYHGKEPKQKIPVIEPESLNKMKINQKP